MSLSRKDATFGSMRKYRDTSDMVYKMLEHMSDEPKSRTDVMYAAKLSYTQLVSYMNMLIEKELIVSAGPKNDAKNKSSVLYRTTEKGKQVVQMIEKLRELLT